MFIYGRSLQQGKPQSHYTSFNYIRRQLIFYVGRKKHKAKGSS